MPKKEPRSKVSWSLCQCEINGLVRPTNGPVRIRETDVVDKDILQAKLSGPLGGVAHTVKLKDKYYFVPPDKKAREVPADTLTDALHAGVWMVNEELKKKKKLPNQRREMPHVAVSKINKKV